MRHHFELRIVAAVIVLAASLLSAARCSGGASGPPVATVNLRLDRATVPIGGPLEMTFRFDVSPDLEPMTEDYTVFVHVLDNSGEQLWIDDHPPATPTSEWEPGQTIEYSRRIMMPLYPYIGKGDIAVGLYRVPTRFVQKYTLKRFQIGLVLPGAVVVLLRIPMQEDRCVPIRWICESGRSSTAMPG